MIKFEVGKRFPLEKYNIGRELTVAILNELSFDILVSLSGITSDERKAFKKGKLVVALYRHKHTPFVAIQTETMNFDVSIDTTKLSEEQLNVWLNSIANSINIYLVDSDTATLEAMRFLGINFAEELRDICEEQSALSPHEVQSEINEALSSITTEFMLKNSVKKITF